MKFLETMSKVLVYVIAASAAIEVFIKRVNGDNSGKEVSNE